MLPPIHETPYDYGRLKDQVQRLTYNPDEEEHEECRAHQADWEHKLFWRVDSAVRNHWNWPQLNMTHVQCYGPGCQCRSYSQQALQ